MQEELKDISFDNYVETYKHVVQDSIDFIGKDVDFFINIKARLLLEIAKKHLGSTDNVNALDIGSGIGLVDMQIASYFKSLTGVDVEKEVVSKAANNNSGIIYKLYDGKHLPFEDGTFDLAFAVNVMHHVPVGLWDNFAAEMQRVIKKKGIAVVFEHNPLNPLTRKAVRQCEFDRDAILLPHGKIKNILNNSGLKVIDSGYIIFFPFSGAFFRKTEKLLKKIPLGAQHFAAAVK